jgi:hypothetical protein
MSCIAHAVTMATRAIMVMQLKREYGVFVRVWLLFVCVCACVCVCGVSGCIGLEVCACGAGGKSAGCVRWA